jgi:hypothetical protein
MTDTTALALPSGSALADVFSNLKNIDPIIKRIRDEVKSHTPDLSTEKGRKEIASLAYKVSRSKTALDDAGKKLTEDIKRQAGQIDAARKKIRDQLDALRDEVRKPLTDWEAAEELRVQSARATIDEVRFHGLPDEYSSADVAEAAARVKSVEAKPEYAEYLPQIEAARENTLAALRVMYSAAKKREEQEAELARLRAEAEARAEADRIKAEQEAAAQAEADRAKREAEEAEESARQEAERAARIEAEKAEAARLAAEQEKAAAAEREAALARQAEEAAERHRKELAEAKAREEAAAQAERDRIAAERKAEEDARAKREADAAHRAKIAKNIANALRAMAGDASPEKIAEALIAGKIPHVTVSM